MKRSWVTLFVSVMAVLLMQGSSEAGAPGYVNANLLVTALQVQVNRNGSWQTTHEIRMGEKYRFRIQIKNNAQKGTPTTPHGGAAYFSVGVHLTQILVKIHNFAGAKFKNGQGWTSEWVTKGFNDNIAPQQSRWFTFAEFTYTLPIPQRTSSRMVELQIDHKRIMFVPTAGSRQVQLQ